MKLILIFPLSLILSGCIIDRTKTYNTSLSDINSNNVNHVFFVGKTKKDILEKLGPPQNSLEFMKENHWSYTNKESIHGFVLIPPIPVGMSKTKKIDLYFNEKNELNRFTFHEE
ncbi:hypothetical protein CWC46_16390 [Prodigiosinella confusarubida]|uniref:Lipoprotein SmpA/OmlA domain-containing protein n=1 Tax=Serratia sp. (strain ATCC 39006) TaxID=104623 RepID=A0A2I5T9Q3_SERS3|nr:MULTISPECIES: hypothetical protein [Enterobacterales]AUH01252.1 hypothetical protein CWC46_16390 [Serratia sp. ATCC 39006]AUH05573.1 hypothetical protein Ser39006_016390 [Serratia sp. ATCC 39006]